MADDREEPPMLSSSSFRTPDPLSFTGNLAENFSKFMQSYNIYMKATRNSTHKTDVKAAIFLNLAGSDAQGVVNTFGLSTEAMEVEEDVIAAFRNYCMPRKNIVYERYIFYNRNKKEGESFDHFLTEIKKLSRSCEFADCESMLRDRIVLGIGNVNLQERLLRVPNLTLDQAVEHCQAAELSFKQVRVLQGEQRLDVVKTKSTERVNYSNSAGNKEAQRNTYNCKKCGKKHARQKCPAFGKLCNNCNKPNHFVIGCFAKNNKGKRHTDGMSTVDDHGATSLEETFMLDVLINNMKQCWFETLVINGVKIRCKLDTGADINVMPLSVYKSVSDNDSVLLSKPLKIVTYGGNMIKPLGIARLKCKLKGVIYTDIEFAVVNVSDTVILGLTMCEKLNLVQRVKSMSRKEMTDVQTLVSNNIDVFEGIGCFPKEQSIILRKGTVPVVKPFFRIAESLRARLKETLEIYEKNKFITKVNEPTDWVHNLVIVEKTNGDLRLCLDPRELNEAVKREHFPIPTVDELTPYLANKKWFTVLDMKDGFFQLKLNSASSKLCVFHTPYGRYRFLRMPFGLASAPEIFQKASSQMFGDIQGVLVYFDDLIIGAVSIAEHDAILAKVIERAREYNIKFNSSKVQFRVDKVRYIGQVFSEKGISPDPGHVEAIVKLKNPNNKKELQSLMGMINYLGKFIPHLSQITAPLRELLKKNVEWNWEELHTTSINKLKKLIAEAPVLKCFDATKSLTIQTDSSKDGLGCCLLMGKDPISFASRSLTTSEKNYSQIEKELLAIRFATMKFHTFIYGREVVVQTDHKPLISIVKKDMAKIPTRLQRMCLGLLKYNLKLTYLPGKYMYVADLLSRNFPVTLIQEDPVMLERIHTVDVLLPISAPRLEQLQKETEKDLVLKGIQKYCTNGWPRKLTNVQPGIKWAWKLRNQLRIKQGIILLENKVVVPRGIVNEMLEIIHQGHLGVIKCKKKARQLLYWAGMSRDIENMVLSCKTCEKYRRANVKEPLIQHKVPDLPFEVIGTDICSYAGKDYLVTACYLTKWLEVQELCTKTSEEVIKKLKIIFATHGIPKVMVSDNVPFASLAFKHFTDSWGIKQTLSSPYYPKSNGLAERMVGVAKQLIKKSVDSGGDFHLSLLEYRNSPLEGMEESPAQLLMNRRLRTLLPVTTYVLKPRISGEIKQITLKNKLKQEKYYNIQSRARQPLKEGDSIILRNKKVWEPGVIKQVLKEPRSYIVTDAKGHSYRRNKQDLRLSRNPPPLVGNDIDDGPDVSKVITSGLEEEPAQRNAEEISDFIGGYRTRSGRLVRKPGRYSDFV